MRKRFLKLLLSRGLLIMLLNGCAKEIIVDDLDLELTYQPLLNDQDENMEALVMIPETNTDYIDSIYEGLSSIELNQQIACFAPVTGWAAEVMLVEVTNEEDVETVVDIFEARIE